MRILESFFLPPIRRYPMHLSVCSWSLRPASPADLADKVLACGLSAVQLALDPIRSWEWRPDEAASLLRARGIRISSGMMATHAEDYSTLATIMATGGIRPDEHWDLNLRNAEACAVIAARYGLSLVTFHAGFLPHDAADEERGRMLDRLRQIALVFAARNVGVALETGQEDAETLLAALHGVNESLPARAKIGVNFDPANMILYGMGDPVEALKKLLPHVRQVHIKDAVPASVPGSWGSEVRVGDGSVDWPGFFAVLASAGRTIPMVIEREAGEARTEDVLHAASVIRGYRG